MHEIGMVLSSNPWPPKPNDARPIVNVQFYRRYEQSQEVQLTREEAIQLGRDLLLLAGVAPPWWKPGGTYEQERARQMRDAKVLSGAKTGEVRIVHDFAGGPVRSFKDLYAERGWDYEEALAATHDEQFLDLVKLPPGMRAVASQFGIPARLIHDEREKPEAPADSAEEDSTAWFQRVMSAE